MQFKSLKNATLISFSEEISFNLEELFKQIHQRIAHENLVVDLTTINDFKAIEPSIIESLSQLESLNKSLVWVSTTADFTDIDEAIVLVPTLQEAEDLIEMDEISRDLGF